MKVNVKKKYYKRIRRGKEPCKYKSVQPNGVGTDIFMVISLDPILKKKKLKKIKDGMVGHEIHEVRYWGKGENACHSRANRREPYITRVKLKGVKGFWKHCEKEGLV